MTELETLERAKMYMKKLANGIDPLDGTAIPDEDVVNNVRLSRCFFYVADVLRQVINHGGTVPQKKPKKLPFAILPIWHMDRNKIIKILIMIRIQEMGQLMRNYMLARDPEDACFRFGAISRLFASMPL